MPAHQLFPSLPLPRENRPNDDFLQEALMDPLKFHTRRLTHSQEQSSKKNEKTSITTAYLKHWHSPAKGLVSIDRNPRERLEYEGGGPPREGISIGKPRLF